MPIEKNATGLGEVFDSSASAYDQFAEVDFLECHFVDEVVALGEREERVEQRGGCSAFGDDLFEGITILFFGAMAVKRQLSGGKHDGDRCSEVVRGIRGELAEAGDGCFKPGEKLIPRYGELLNLVLCGGNGKSLREIADADAEGGAGHAIDGLQRVAAEKVAAEGREQKKRPA